VKVLGEARGHVCVFERLLRTAEHEVVLLGFWKKSRENISLALSHFRARGGNIDPSSCILKRPKKAVMSAKDRDFEESNPESVGGEKRRRGGSEVFIHLQLDPPHRTLSVYFGVERSNLRKQTSLSTCF
jgi:hypothetical protein